MSARDSGSVVVAVDGKPGSAGALKYAADRAIRGSHTLHLVHAWPGYVPQDLVPVVTWAALQAEGRAVLDQSAALAGELAPGCQVTTELVVGPRIAGVLAAARGGRLMVVGRSPHHRVEAPGGGTPTSLATRSGCPVVVVPSTWSPGLGPGRIVVAMKSRTHARELLSRAFKVAWERDARVEVVTAWELYDPIMDREEAKDHAAEWEAEGIRVLEGLVAEWRGTFPTVPVGLRVIHGRAASVLERASADADLLLIARRQHFVPPYGRLGSTAHRVLRTSRCPVEVVPAGVLAEVPALVSAGSRTT
jgi:nucleotide-binding universal stress UspA family protein